MAAALLAASIPSWIPEDDLLLKNAVEGGASLEALAKGAVRFSRKFSLGELRDRWYSLLYDPIISEEASAKMMEFEFSVKNDKVSSAQVSAKRKLESVRRLYYVMRKKSRGHHTSCRDTMVFDTNHTHFGFDGKECCNELHVGASSFEQDNMGRIVPHNVRDRLVDFQSCDRVKEMRLSHSLSESSPSFHAGALASPLAMWEMVEDVSASAMPITASIEDKGQHEVLMHRNDVELNGNKTILSGMSVMHSEEILQNKHDADVLNNSTAISECDYADLSESLLNFVNEDELLLVDADGEEAIDKSCYDGLLVNCPNDFHGNSSDAKDSETLFSDKSLAISASTCPAEAIAECSLRGDVEQHGHLHSEISLLPSVLAVNTESYDGEMECTLNSEDTEIPCNDDVFLHKEFSSSIMARTSKETGYQFLSCPKDDKHKQSLVEKEGNPTKSLVVSRIKGLEILPVTNPVHQLVGCGVKCQFEDVAFRQARNADTDPNQNSTALATLTSAKVGLLNAESSHACDAMGLPLYAQAGSPEQITSVPEADPSMLNEEESESDDDVPSYSEIEAMILQMDLCPDDTDSYICREVSRYQNEDARRSIIRLEQCARSSMQRAIASRGALALLYGRHLKHYIRKTEVIIGRATDDMEVDIDLGREGPANKISRRQALIKLDTDGSFFLKNLGRSPVFLNGKEVVTGHSMVLGSSSLIEVCCFLFYFGLISFKLSESFAPPLYLLS
eukprot:XP_015583342.1 uncharacterized protein LOC8273017 [Ricinus communis]